MPQPYERKEAESAVGMSHLLWLVAVIVYRLSLSFFFSMGILLHLLWHLVLH